MHCGTAIQTPASNPPTTLWACWRTATLFGAVYSWRLGPGIQSSKCQQHRRSVGPRWVQRISEQIRDSHWTYPKDMSRKVIKSIADVAQSGVRLEHAVAIWREHISQRTDVGQRRRSQTKTSTTTYLILSDVDNTDYAVDGNTRTIGSHGEAPSGSDSDIEVVPPAASSKMTVRERQKQAIRDEQQDDSQDPGSGAAGSSRKRLRSNTNAERLRLASLEPMAPLPCNQIILGPERSRGLSPEELSARQRPAGVVVIDDTRRATHACRARALADGMRDILDIFTDICNPDNVKANCRDQCQARVQWIAQSLRSLIAPSINALYNVTEHSSGGGPCAST